MTSLVAERVAVARCPHCGGSMVLPDRDGGYTCLLCCRTAEVGLEGRLVVRYPQVCTEKPAQPAREAGAYHRLEPKACAICGTMFQPKVKRQRTCGTVCGYVSAKRKRDCTHSERRRGASAR